MFHSTPQHYPVPWPFNHSLQQPYRFMAGRPMNGARYTDATFLYRGTRALDISGRAPRYHYLPGYQRSLMRTLPVYGAIQGGHDALTASMRWLDVHTFIPAADFAYHESFAWNVSAHAWSALPLTLAGATYKAVRAFRGRQWRNEVTGPLARAIGPLIGRPADQHSKWLEVPRTYAEDGGAAVVVHLPQDYVGQQGAKNTLVDTITGRLKMADVEATWDMAGADPTLTLSEKPKPPGKVLFSDVREHMEQAAEDAPVIGLGTGGAPASISLALDSPHVMVTGGSGGGKSVLVKAMVAHFLHHGARVVFLDPKGESHLWAKGLPGVTYAFTIEDIHDALLELGEEQTQRQADAHHGRRPKQRLVVVAEEMNMAMPGLRAHWAAIREKSDPVPSPAVQASGNLAFGGRSMLMTCLWVTQSATARAYGGPEARENYGVNAMARQSHRQWKMINAGIPMPKLTRHEGRWTITSAGESRAVQVSYLDDDDARSWSLSGVDNVTGEQRAEAADPWSDVATPSEKTLEFARLVTLRYIAEAHELNLKRVRKWADSDPDFPAPAVPAAGRNGAQYEEADVELYLVKKLSTRESL